MGIRRVVTGHDENGKAVFVSDDEVEGSGSGASTARMWAADEIPTYPNSGAVPPAPPQFFPEVGGFRFIIVTYPPDSERPAVTPPPAREGFGGVERSAAGSKRLWGGEPQLPVCP